MGNYSGMSEWQNPQAAKVEVNPLGNTSMFGSLFGGGDAPSIANNSAMPQGINTDMNGMQAAAPAQATVNTGSSTMGTLGGIASGIQALTGMYSAWQANKLAKQQLGLQKEQWQAQKKTMNEAMNTRADLKYNTGSNKENAKKAAYKKENKV